VKYTVITGASSGIGYATALAFAKQGKNVIVAARRKERLEQLKEEIKNNNYDVEVIIKTVDLSVTENIYSFYDSLNQYDLETFINCAGFGDFSSIKEQNLEKAETMLHLNVEAVTLLSSLFVKDYENVEGTTLINVSSAGGYIMISDFITYSASKFYVNAFTEGLAQELQEKNAKLQAKIFAPAVTETEFELHSLDVDQYNYEQNAGKYNTPEEAANYILELYNSDKILGIVDENTYEFHLQDPVFPFRSF